MTLYTTSRKLHRYFVMLILALGLLMAVTGISLKYFIGDTALTRYLHNNLSVLFTVVLLIMIFTGTYLYFYPWYTKRKQNQLQKNQKNA